jgi:hypothetical protein
MGLCLLSIEVWDLVFCHEDTKAGRFVFKSLGRFAWGEEKTENGKRFQYLLIK